MIKGLRERERKLISILQMDGRASLSYLGRTLGISHVAVRNKIQSLRKRGLIRISAWVNPSQLGLKHAIISIECVNSEAEERLIRRFKNCPRLIFLSRNVGGNLLAVMTAEDMGVLEAITSECAIRTDESVRRSDIVVGSAIVYPEHVPLRIIDRRSSPPCGVDCCSCRRYEDGSCPGCPASTCYRGRL